MTIKQLLKLPNLVFSPRFKVCIATFFNLFKVLYYIFVLASNYGNKLSIENTKKKSCGYPYVYSLH